MLVVLLRVTEKGPTIKMMKANWVHLSTVIALGALALMPQFAQAQSTFYGQFEGVALGAKFYTSSGAQTFNLSQATSVTLSNGKGQVYEANNTVATGATNQFGALGPYDLSGTTGANSLIVYVLGSNGSTAETVPFGSTGIGGTPLLTWNPTGSETFKFFATSITWTGIGTETVAVDAYGTMYGTGGTTITSSGLLTWTFGQVAPGDAISNSFGFDAPATTPEPGAMALAAVAFVSTGVFVKRRRK